MKKYIITVLGAIGLILLSGCEDPSVIQKTPDRSPWIKANADPLMIQLPESGISIAMNQTIRRNGRTYIAGAFRRTIAQDGVERDMVLADTEAGTTITMSADMSSQVQLYAVPFAVSNQGSGNFHYVGLFVLNTESGQRVHLDSYFLGDRVQDIRLIDAGRAVKVAYLKHASDQSFADDLTEETFVNLYIEKDMKLRPYTGMHPSWDINHNGINDCEEDGTCDDSVDYTLARELVSSSVQQE